MQWQGRGVDTLIALAQDNTRLDVIPSSVNVTPREITMLFENGSQGSITYDHELGLKFTHTNFIRDKGAKQAMTDDTNKPEAAPSQKEFAVKGDIRWEPGYGKETRKVEGLDGRVQVTEQTSDNAVTQPGDAERELDERPKRFSNIFQEEIETAAERHVEAAPTRERVLDSLSRRIDFNEQHATKRIDEAYKRIGDVEKRLRAFQIKGWVLVGAGVLMLLASTVSLATSIWQIAGRMGWL